MSTRPTIIQLAVRYDLAVADLENRKATLKEAVLTDALSMHGVEELAKKAAHAESECDKAREAYRKGLIANRGKVVQQIEKLAKAQAREDEKQARAQAQTAAKVEREAKRAADRKANKRAKALDRCSKLHLSAIEKAKSPIERMIADRLTDTQIESSLDACIECKDSGRIAFAHAMFSTAYARLRSVLETVGVVESEGLLAIVAKYEVVLARAGFNTLSLREELKRAA